jgi:CO/xanthine dehydrogenase FAD-binding subunit
MLHSACREIGAAQIQARGTIGGNIANSSPVGDTLPALLALNANIELRDHKGQRTVPYSKFCTAYRQTVLRGDELIVAIHVPWPTSGALQYWRKVGTRSAQSISKVMMAAVGRVQDCEVTEVRIAFGAMADRPVRIASVEKLVLHQTLDEALLDKVRDALAAELSPIDDVRSQAAYRMQVAQNLLQRFLKQLAG